MTLTLAVALPGAARAAEATAFEAVAELPAALVRCVGDAMQPGMLRFAFQAEPEWREPPEVIRTGARREQRPAARQAAPRQAARQLPAGQPILWLPCIQG